ncbi:MAG: DNA helicase RecQ [Candidatus Hydrogenedentes bacterium]|nr:DNA helicase RecQ [Candidatus Hydrogenedentota bacterium]
MGVTRIGKSWERIVDKLRGILKKYWGFDGFLPMQPDAMKCVLSGRDSVVVLPTGGGKSLCFQAPAMAMDGMAVVVSPLLSLMKDQVDALRTNGVPAAKIDSTMTSLERSNVHREIREHQLKLLYVSPERVVQPQFIAYLRDAGVSFFVVDEAHCISQWGHDFRPEYRALRELRQAFPDRGIHAYTATATTHVREDIARELCLREPAMLVGSFDRPNLVYRVQRRSDGFSQVRQVIDAHPKESGIIYCIRRSEVDVLCERLVGAGYRARPYHAGMDDDSRKRNQDAFTNEKADIIVATVAFGMGIDKSNVRYVVHAAMPKSIEHYHQETGRAGRDNLPADCRLLYSYADLRLWQSIIEKTATDATAIAVAKLRDMFQYCDRVVCRHRALVSYFGQTYDGQPCGACDVCLSELDGIEDAGSVATAILSCVGELGDIAGPTYTTLVLTGSQEERVLAKGHQRLGSYGALASNEARQVRDWIEQLVQQGCLRKTGEYNILALTPKGVSALRGEETPQLTRPYAKRVKKPQPRTQMASPLDEIDQGLFEALRQVRLAKAEELGVPPFVVFSDATLRDLARRKPKDKAGFLTMYGIGEKKCEAFADEFLEVIRRYCADHPEAETASDSDEVAVARKSERNRNETQRRAAELFAQGRSIAEVATFLQRKPSTVEGYLIEYLEDAGITDPSPWVEPTVVARVFKAASATKAERLKPIFEHLNGEVSYSTIRICLTCARNTTGAGHLPEQDRE